MPQQVNLKPYKYTVNGKTYFDVAPDYNVSNQYTPATTQELQQEIENYHGKTDSWSQNYLQSLQSGLSKIQSGISPYALNERGILDTKSQIALHAENEAGVKAGTIVNLGTAEAPRYVPRNAALDLMHRQLEDAQKQVNAIGSSANFTPSTQKAKSSLATGEINTNNALLVPTNISIAAAIASGVEGSTPDITAYQKLIEKAQADQAALQKTASTGIAGLLGQKPTPLSFDEINKQVLTSLGLPADFTKQQFQQLQTTASEIKGLNEQMANIDKKEQLRLAAIEGQAIPMGNINSQSIQAKRYFAIEKTSIAADISVKSAYANALQGNFQLVNQLIDRAVNYATHEQDQKIADYKWMYDNYQEQFKSLTDREYQLYNNLIQSYEKERDITREDLKWKIKTYIDNGLTPPDANTLKNMSIADVGSYVGQNKITKPLEISAGASLYDPITKKFIATAPVKLTSSSNYIPGSNPEVDNWAKLIISGQSKITDVPNPRGSTLRSDVVDAITNSGQLLLSDKDREKLSTLDTAFNVYGTIKELSEKINTFGTLGRISGAVGRYLGGATQYNTDIARYNATREGFVSNVARTLGEKGTLAEGDVRRAINNLPTINDTKAVAQGKLQTLKSILDGAKSSIIQKSTTPTSGLTSGTINNSYQDYLKVIK